jgi:hypothetical protein
MGVDVHLLTLRVGCLGAAVELFELQASFVTGLHDLPITFGRRRELAPPIASIAL